MDPILHCFWYVMMAGVHSNLKAGEVRGRKISALAWGQHIFVDKKPELRNFTQP